MMGEIGNSEVQVKFISESFVKPKYKPEASNEPFYLSPVELLLLSNNYTQRGMIFSYSNCNNPAGYNIENFLNKLTHSLSLSLVHFYTFVGQLATEKLPEEENASLIFVDCTKGPGARVLHASLHLNVSDLISPSGEVSPTVRFLFDLGEMKINHDGHTHPLLSIQVTELLDGIFMGFTVNHCVADGASIWHFISVLSEIFLSGSAASYNNNNIIISRIPIIKSFVLDGYGPVHKLRHFDPKEALARLEPSPIRVKIFQLSSASVAALKDKVNKQGRVHSQDSNIFISSFVALAALLWRSITRARNSNPDEKTHVIVPANVRSRLVPPLSEDRLGSFLYGAQSSSTVGELLGQDLGWAAILIRKDIAACNDVAIRGFFKWCADTSFVAKQVERPNTITFAGSTKFDVFGSEFGFGKAVATTNNYEGLSDGKVVTNPGREGGGSVELQIALRPETMSALESDDKFMSYVSQV